MASHATLQQACRQEVDHDAGPTSATRTRGVREPLILTSYRARITFDLAAEDSGKPGAGRATIARSVEQ